MLVAVVLVSVVVSLVVVVSAVLFVVGVRVCFGLRVAVWEFCFASLGLPLLVTVVWRLPLRFPLGLLV